MDRIAILVLPKVLDKRAISLEDVHRVIKKVVFHDKRGKIVPVIHVT